MPLKKETQQIFSLALDLHDLKILLLQRTHQDSLRVVHMYLLFC